MTTKSDAWLASSSLKGLPLQPIDPEKLATLKRVLAEGVEEMRKKRKKKQPLPSGRAR